MVVTGITDNRDFVYPFGERGGYVIAISEIIGCIGIVFTIKCK